MSESVLSVNGSLNTCYIFYLRFADCVRRETFFDLMCKEQSEDWIECKTKKRYVRIFFLNFIFILEKF
jgi:hypothetical protein